MITELLIGKLKTEIDFYQQAAVKASKMGDHKKCQSALLKQDDSIQTLIQISQSYNKNPYRKLFLQ
jgi:hypothetical protein